MILLLSDIPEYPARVSVADLIARRRDKDPSFNVGRRTIERDLRHLAKRFPIRFDATSKPGGWSFDKGARLVFPLMGDAEAMTLVLAERMISGLLPPSVVNEIKPLVRQAQMKVHFGGKRQLAEWPRKVRIVRNIPKRIGADVDAELMNVLYGAVFAERQLEVGYLKLGAKEPTTYLLNPLGLVLREPVVYLICTRADSPKLLHWPVHRFASARRTGRQAQIPEDFDLQRELDRGLMGYAVTGKDLRLKLRFPSAAVGRFLEETPLSADQRSRSRDGALIIEATVRDTLELRWWIYAFGPRVEVLAPLRFRTEISESLLQAAGLYRTHA